MIRRRLPVIAVMVGSVLAHADDWPEVVVSAREAETPRECRLSPGLARELRAALGPPGWDPDCVDVKARPLATLCRQSRCDVAPLLDRVQRLRVPNVGRRAYVRFARSSDGHRCDDTFLASRPLTRFEVTPQHAGRTVRLRLRRDAMRVYVRAPDGRWFCDRPVLFGEDAERFLDVPLGPLSAGTWNVFIGSSSTWFLGDEPFGLIGAELPASVELSIIPEPTRDAG